MIVIEKKAPREARATERISLPFDTRCKSRLRTHLASGEEAGIELERGSILRGGDKLIANDGRIVEVVASTESLMEARSGAPMLLMRAAYHLGNRHVAVDFKPGLLRIATDHVLGEMLRGLGLKVTHVEAAFEPESGAYGGHAGHSGHSEHGNHEQHAGTPAGHSADGEGHGPRIHDNFGS